MARIRDVGGAHAGHLRLCREREEKRHGQVLRAVVRTLQSPRADLCTDAEGACELQEQLAKVAYDNVVIAEIDADHYKDIAVDIAEGARWA